MTDTPPVRLGDRLVTIVETFLAAPRQSLSEVSAACGMEPSTTSRYLRQLVEHGWLERDEETRLYSLGVRMIAIGHAARSARPLRARLLPHMRELVMRFDETVNLAVHQSGEVVVIEAVEGGRSIRRGASVGDRDNWFTSSLGKAIMAHLPEWQVVQLWERHRPDRRTQHTLVELDAALADLEAVRRNGYALDDEEEEIGLKCVGVAISDARGQYTHALSISGPTARMNERLTETIEALQSVARSVDGGRREAR
ncbi:IclR family transcriptional regulator [Dactylosporangium sp. NPDC051541]|uniref:IclR family transcriptional regulator n=1 Tax=Dactylosporangium sp. NPDC051541 TaxID=3363977 RepID=UPI00379BF675